MIKFSVKTDVGKVRKANEDCAGFSLSDETKNNGDLFVVCDGMGGHVGGAAASNLAVQTIIETFKLEYYENPFIAINNAIVKANAAIYQKTIENPELKGMGTTCTVLLRRGDEYFIGHVGDSRVYLVADGKRNRLTKDHSFVQNLVDEGIIQDEEAEEHPRKNELLKALGIREEVQPTVANEPIIANQGDVFLLCSDGLTGFVSDQDIETIVSSTDDLDITAENLINLANEGGGLDNITVALIKVEDEISAVRKFVHFNPIPNLAVTGEMSGEIPPIVDSKETVETKSFFDRFKLPIIIGGGVLLALVVYLSFFNNTTEESGDKTEAETTTCPCDKIAVEKLTHVVKEGENFQLIKEKLKGAAGNCFTLECLAINGASIKNEGVDIDLIMPNDTVSLDPKCLCEQLSKEPQEQKSEEENLEGKETIVPKEEAPENNPTIEGDVEGEGELIEGDNADVNDTIPNEEEELDPELPLELPMDIPADEVYPPEEEEIEKLEIESPETETEGEGEAPVVVPPTEEESAGDGQ